MSDPKLNDAAVHDYFMEALMKIGDSQELYKLLIQNPTPELAKQVIDAALDAASTLMLMPEQVNRDAEALASQAPDDAGVFFEGPGLPEPVLKVDDLWEIAAADEDPVFSDPDPRMVARAEGHSDAAYADAEVPGSLWSETQALEDRFFGDLLAGPEEDREDQLVREIDETGQDWNRAAEEDDQ